MTYIKHLVTPVIASILLLSSCGKQEEASEDAHAEHMGETTATTIVRLEKHKVYHAGIKTELVQNKSVAVPLSFPGKVSFDERRLAEITARVSGRIEQVNVFTNDRVRGDAVLLELFSQEYLTMQNEFFQASERWKRSQELANDEKGAAKAIYESAKRKLIVIGLTEAEVSELETSRVPQTHFHIRAPFEGTIIKSKVRLGEYVQVGAEIFELADLSTLWVLADLYEKDLPHVRTGMRAQVEVAAYSDSFSGTISTIYGVLDEKTRTVKARVQVANKHGKLKPEMFCTVNIQTQFGRETIKIPASALLGETEKHFVFIAVNDTTFEKRDIRTGVETREFAEVVDGLILGEKLVVKGGFFLKSELGKETFGEEH
ncbi:MAG: HlyD protein [Bacteroidetes bacterium]|nr:HlyD protein [Bacteroidota bacterium]MBM2840192.1 HlyD protein [Bacteroidota bacterium]